MIMSSAGYIYTQLMEEASSAQHGPFYVTNVLEVNHEDLKVLMTSLSWSIGTVTSRVFSLALKGRSFPSFYSLF